tara:strand:+ start:2131 stop:3342 length:1212 start_codon:yes stop_codon:yes gene_type:complete
MIKNNKFNLLSILLILIIGIVFVNSEGEETEDLGISIGLPEGTIIGQGVFIEPFEGGGGKFTIASNTANLNINGNDFTNILNQEVAGHPTFIDVDESGKITRAEFTVITNEDEIGIEYTTYVFGNTQISVPEGSRVFFSDSIGIEVTLPENSKIEIPTAKDASLPIEYAPKFIGKGMFLPSRHVASGRINFDKDGQAFLFSGELLSIDNVRLGDESFGVYDDTFIYFDGKEHEGSFYSFSPVEDNLIISHKGETRLKFGDKTLFIEGRGDAELVELVPVSVKGYRTPNPEITIPVIPPGNAFAIKEPGVNIDSDLDLKIIVEGKFVLKDRDTGALAQLLYLSGDTQLEVIGGNLMVGSSGESESPKLRFFPENPERFNEPGISYRYNFDISNHKIYSQYYSSF